MALLKTFQKLWQRPKQTIAHKFTANSWDASGHGKRFARWLSSTDSINSLMEQDLVTLRNRSHQVVLNNPVAANGLEAIVTNCIGTGIKPQPKAASAKFREQIQQLWLAWKDEADFDGLTDFYGLQALACRSMLEGGSCFIRMIVHPEAHNLSVPLQLQGLESEHLNHTLNDTLVNGNVIRNGIEYAKTGQRLAYHLYQDHPGDRAHTGETVRIPATELLHIFRPERFGQKNGVPVLSRTLVKLHELDQYDDAELVRKKTAALFAAFVTRVDPDANIMNEVEQDGIALATLEPGTVQLLEPGEDIKFSDPSDVGANYEGFMRQQLRFIATGMGITYEQLTGDLTQLNYSSIRAGLLEFRRRCEMLQRHTIIFQLCRPVWQKWLQLALLSGALSMPKDARRYQAVKWMPQGWDWVDPLKDQQAQKMAVRNGFKSRSQVVSELGHDAEDIDEEILADNNRADKFGLMYDSDTRHAKQQSKR